jgi:O-antigen/teichoic acid export membrane protein
MVAARLVSPAELGVGAALVATMTFLSNLSQLNLNGALARFLPAAGRHGARLVATAYALSGLVALAMSAGFLLLAPALSDRLAFLSRSPGLAALFALAVAAWGVFTLQDTVLTALRGAAWVPVENAVFGLAKIALLVPGLGVFVSWTVAVAVALVPVNVLVFRRLLPRLAALRADAVLPARAVLARFVALDYLGYLFMQAGTNALPVLVTARLGAEANGVFYVGWLLGTSLELVASHFGTSLTVAAAADEARLAGYARQMLRRGLLLFGPVALLLCLAATPLLGLFGTGYAAGGAVLRLFAVAALAKLVLVVYLAACRVRRQVGRIIAVQATTSALVVGLALLTMGRLGVTGVGVAYLIGQVVVAAAVLPALARILRGAR